MPIKTVNGAPVYVRDVAHVRDGYAAQTNIVRRDGRRAVLMTILKGGSASTLERGQPGARRRCRTSRPQLPPELKMELLFDQSVFVRAAIDGVLKEGAIAAGLTALMILFFLGSWRSTLIVAISIPLSILVSIIVLWALGQTLNAMTLGGLALAVGILVDDATVEIENIHRNLAMKKPLAQAILDGAAQIAVPAFVSTLAICIVFVPVVFLTGAGRSLFIPLALAVVFAMLGLVLPVAHPCADHGALPAAAEEARGARGRREGASGGAILGASRSRSHRRFTTPSTAASSGCGWLRACSTGPRSPLATVAACSASPLAPCAVPPHRPGLLPQRGRGPVPAARPRAGRHAHRGDRAHLRPGRGRDPRDGPRQRARP